MTLNQLEEKVQQKEDVFFRWILILLYGFVGLILIAFLVNALPYYLTPFPQRPFHPGYSSYRPAGTYGVLLGLVGSVFLLSLLLYVIKKRTRIFDRLGSNKQWLEVHIFFGITGPFIILLHTSFKLGGLVSISFWSMVGVAVSGAFGRYLYNQIPRNIQGHELSLKECEAANKQISDEIIQTHLLSAEDMDTLFARLDQNSKSGAFWLLSSLKAQIQIINLPRKLKRDLTDRFNLDAESAEVITLLVKKKLKLQLKVHFLNRVQGLFHYWHVLHRPFAFVMYVIMFVHIVIALSFGISLTEVFH